MTIFSNRFSFLIKRPFHFQTVFQDIGSGLYGTLRARLLFPIPLVFLDKLFLKTSCCFLAKKVNGLLIYRNLFHSSSCRVGIQKW